MLKAWTYDAPLSGPQLKNPTCFSLAPSCLTIDQVAKSSRGDSGVPCRTNSFVTSRACLGTTQNLFS